MPRALSTFCVTSQSRHLLEKAQNSQNKTQDVWLPSYVHINVKKCQNVNHSLLSSIIQVHTRILFCRGVTPPQRVTINGASVCKGLMTGSSRSRVRHSTAEPRAPPLYCGRWYELMCKMLLTGFESCTVPHWTLVYCTLIDVIVFAPQVRTGRYDGHPGSVRMRKDGHLSVPVQVLQQWRHHLRRVRGAW